MLAKTTNLKKNGGGKKSGKTNAQKSMAPMMDVTKEYVIDDDEDNDLFGDPNICTNMMKNKEALQAECSEVCMSKRMHDKSSKTTSVFVAFSPPKNTFYIKDEYLRIGCSTMHHIVHPSMEILNLITTIKDVQVQKEQH